MKNSLFLSLSLIGLLSLGALTSCEDEVPTVKPEPTTPQTSSLRAQVASLPLPRGMEQGGSGDLDLPPLDPIEPQVDDETIEPGTFDGLRGIFINRRRVYNSGFAFDELSIFNPSESQIYPGCVFVGSSITNGKYLRLPGKTGEIVWSAKDLIPGSPTSFVAHVSDPRESDYSQIVQQWFGQPTQPLSATTMFEVNELSNSTEIGAKLGIGFQKEDLIAKLKLDTNHQRMKTHVLVKAIQKTFSTAVDVPDHFILKSAKVEDMDGVMPVYVSEVFYGRMGYAVISSNHEYHEVVAALNLNIPSEKVDVELETKYKQILDASLTKSRVIGGSSEEHGYGMSMGWEGFKKSLSAPLTPSTTKPVAYTLRYVHDNSVARLVFTSDFVRNESYFVPEMDQLNLRFTPRTLRAKDDNVKPLYIYGEVTIARDGDREQVIFQRDRKDYIRIDEPEQEVPLGEGEALEVSIRRPSGMSMEDFLKETVTIRAFFSHTNAAGTANIHDLGSVTSTCTVRELLFAAMRGTMNVFTQEKRAGQREANLVMDVDMNNSVRVLDGSFSVK